MFLLRSLLSICGLSRKALSVTLSGTPPTWEGGEYFRAGVGAIILDRAGQVLALERSDVGNAWQLPQGGMHRQELPLNAVLREVEEETGLSQKELELVGQLPELLAYELPESFRNQKTGRGQVHYWFVFRVKGDKPSITPPPGEFRRAHWTRLERLVEDVVEFRKPVYRRLMQLLNERLARTNHTSA
jgi:putative (di)nucleoside polyphosphate hydrolase